MRADGRKNVRVTKPMLDRIIALRRRDLSFRAIAEVIDLDYGAAPNVNYVRDLCVQAGLPPKFPGRRFPSRVNEQTGENDGRG